MLIEAPGASDDDDADIPVYLDERTSHVTRVHGQGWGLKCKS
jgi:hypothetical protein